MPEKKEPKVEITVLDRREVVTFPKLRQPKTQLVITYLAKDYPPRTITIPKEEWSAEREKKDIKKDLEKLKAVKPEVYEV